MLGPTNVYDHFLEQSGWCGRLGSPFVQKLLECLAEDYKTGGPTAEICSDWQGDPRRDALGLRLSGALHYAVLTGAAPDLANLYPAKQPDWDMRKIWPRARAWLEVNVTDVRHFIQTPPQTNETRRSIALLAGFLKVAERFDGPLHLLELGASAGLNQFWDQYSYETQNWSWPREDRRLVRLKTYWTADAPPISAPIVVASRKACDQAPIDLTDPEHVLRLKSFVWPDQTDRLLRLEAAIGVAQLNNVKVEKADAAEWLAKQLAHRPKSGITIVYHSVFLVYPPRPVIEKIMTLIREAGAAATETAPLAWVCLESESLFGGPKDSAKFQARVEYWPDHTVEVYAETDGHITFAKNPREN